MIEIRDLHFSYADKPVFSGLNLDIGDGITCITGPSGCGKSTLLRLLAGLEKPTGGRISGVPERPALMFQENRLLPWLTAEQNVAAVLPKHARADAIGWLERVETAELSQSLPGEMSGGQCRRVSLARALAYGGGILLLDEPFTGLDPALTERMTELVRSVEIPVVAVLHSTAEVALLGGKNISL